MNVKCPYCGCVYNINYDMLKNPIGSEKLGYGWWLRCYKCQKKWWLKNSAVEMSANSPLIADRQAKIDKILQLNGNKREQRSPKKTVNLWKIFKYVVLLMILLAIGGIIYNKEMFHRFLLDKANHLSVNLASKLTMTDVRYFIEEDRETKAITLTVKGKIVNDDRNVAKLRGVKIFVMDSSGKEIKSWDAELKYGYIVSGDSLDFSTSKSLSEKVDNNIRVDVSIF